MSSADGDGWDVMMPDVDGYREGENFDGQAEAADHLAVKGASAQDWGMQHRLSRIFSPIDRRTVMLAFDHGYFLGPISGLERIATSIPPLLPDGDAIMLTRGALRTSIPPSYGGGVVLRASGGPSVLRDLSDEHLAIGIDDAVRLGADALAIQVFIGNEHESRSVQNLTRLVDEGQRFGVPVLGVTAVGKELTRDARYFRLATRIMAELGATFVKSYYVDEGFESVVAACPVPIVVAGGKKLPEREALDMAYRAVSQGAAGVDMGRNIWQSERPAAMLAAIRAIVHHGLDPSSAFDLYQDHKATPQ